MIKLYLSEGMCPVCKRCRAPRIWMLTYWLYVCPCAEEGWQGWRK